MILPPIFSADMRNIAMQPKRLTALSAATLLTFMQVVSADENESEWLFVQTSQGIQTTDENALVVPFDREVFAFTDRPDRKHQYLNAHEFVSVWTESGDSFEADPPNAILTWTEDGVVQELEIELLNAKVEDFGRTLLYELSTADAERTRHIPDTDVSIYVDGGFLSSMSQFGCDMSFGRAC
ncbi:hypothetical protein [Spiribacter onubensis]|uniref:Uncharacterized protein n=1 Tax=Spiribacter onubensis TaxID=3122420 RepID=A0ABV3SBB5_9GAMM